MKPWNQDSDELREAYEDDRIEALANRIADRWGGDGCPRARYGDHFTFFGDEGLMRYVVWFPNSMAALRETPDGRPFRLRVQNCVIVSCETDAPDAWWKVQLDGKYNTGHSEGTV